MRELLLERIQKEIKVHNYTLRTQQLNQSVAHFKALLSIPQLALFYRLQAETGMLEADNKMQLMKQVAALYQAPGSSLSYKSLYDKYYNFDQSTLEKIREYLKNMRDQASELGRK